MGLHIHNNNCNIDNNDDDVNIQTIPISHALNRISVHTQRSPHATPQHDTSAMDGYALNSAATRNASPDTPVFFQLTGSIAAGDEPLEISGRPDGYRDGDGIYPCVEIMTGARFPVVFDGQETLDCCVRFEDVRVVSTEPSCITNGEGGNDARYIAITKPARYQQNRRLAGADFRAGDVVVSAGETIRAQHIMALASVGITEIPVQRKLGVAVFSTGSELRPPDTERPDAHHIQDVNGPYITSTLKNWDRDQADIEFGGVLDDDADAMAASLKHHLSQQEYDLIITTGAVSSGRFDLVPAALERLGASIVFHRVAMRPGHPVLFATIPSLLSNGDGSSRSTSKSTVFFGLPGNPVASAACLRFLAMPYLQRLLSQPMDRPVGATVRHHLQVQKHCVDENGFPKSNGADGDDLISKVHRDMDVFRPGILRRDASENRFEVELIQDHSPGKVKPFLGANCWIHIPRFESELREGGVVHVFPT